MLIATCLSAIAVFGTAPMPASAAPTFVRAATPAGNSGGNAYMTATFSGATTAGDLIVALATWDDTTPKTISGCSDSAGSTYTVLTKVVHPTDTQGLAMCYTTNANAGTNVVVKMTFNASPCCAAFAATEYSGVLTSSAPDVTKSNTGSGTTTATTGAATTTVNGDLIVAGIVDSHSGATSISQGSGYTQRTMGTATDTANNIAIEDQVQTTAGSITATATFNASTNFDAMLIAFKPAAAVQTQSSYGWYNNANSVQPGSAISTESTAASIVGTSTPVRLRTQIGVTGSSVAASSQQYDLQYGTSTGGPWTTVASPSSWWNTSWSARRKITFNNSASTTNLVNFAALVSLTSSNINYAKTQNAGQDIRFVDADGTTSLSYEIENWNASGTSNVWVKVPQIDAASSTDFIWMYYGNASASDGQAATSVFDSNTSMVQHFEEGNCTVTFTDSTSNANNGTCGGGTQNTTAGKIGQGRDLLGSNQYVNVPDSASLSPTTAYTLSGWVNQSSLGVNRAIAAKWDYTGSPVQATWALQTANNDQTRLRFFIASSTTDAGNNYADTPANSWTTGWHHVAVVYDSTGGTNAARVKIYIDGVSQTLTFTGTIQNNGWDTSSAIRIGDYQGLNRYWNGQIDQFEFDSNARSADWMKAQYLSQNGSMNSFSGETVIPDWKYYDNATPSTGTAVTSTLLTGSTVKETYQEAGPTVVNPNAIAAGAKAEWDWSLDPANTTIGTTYYFRVVLSGSTALDTYSTYPTLTVNATNSPPAAPSGTLAQKKSDQSTTIPTAGYTNETQVYLYATVSDPDGNTVQLCAEVSATLTSPASPATCGSLVTSGGVASVNVTGLVAGTAYKWQVKAKDSNGSYSSTYAQFNSGAVAFTIDQTAPTAGVVNDGPAANSDVSYNTGALNTLSCNWAAFTDAASGVNSYDVAIGTTAGGTDISTGATGATGGWFVGVGSFSAGWYTYTTGTVLSLHTGQSYYCTVRAMDVAGNGYVTASSNGQVVAPTLTFTVGASTVSFATLKGANSYTDTKTLSITAATNAYKGYKILAQSPALLTSPAGKTIPAFNGSTGIAAPDAWLASGRGFGYTMDATSVGGTNIWQPTTCLGGNTKTGAGCYTKFTSSAPGDTIADHTGTFAGSPLSDSYTMTLKIQGDSTYAAGAYSGLIQLSMIATF